MLQSQQITGPQTYAPFIYTYNLMGSLQSVQYPSGRVVAMNFNPGSGQVTAVKNGTSGPAYTTINSYAPNGAVGDMLLGASALHETTQFNTRLQVNSIQTGPLTMGYDYGTSNNNGNVRNATITRTGQSQIQQYFGYDAANRLQIAAEASSLPADCTGTSSWCEKFSYDQFGNRLISGRNNVGASPIEPQGFNSSTNRVSSSGWVYDNGGTGNGNVTADPSGASYSYDGQNRMISATVPVTAGNYKSASYQYDGDGRRVVRITPAMGPVHACLPALVLS